MAKKIFWGMLLGLVVALPVLAQGAPKPDFPSLAKPGLLKTATSTPARVGERIARLEQRRRAIVVRYFEKMMLRFEAADNRLMKIADRIESRLNKFSQEKGKDVTALKAKLLDARAKINEAEDAIREAKNKLESALNSDTPKEQFAALKSLVQDAKEKLKAAHAALVKVVAEIKGASGSPKQETTTPAVFP